ncbi:neuron navigator [Nesidiocoris tenuis]|uniref:Neuron navigator n=1 Tax=Nesidiocoris tenuis TaxID=355587 RepID=A0ABN7AME6_9HEMI|nr:neuron navigator [Nesidiocoris tenuis]
MAACIRAPRGQAASSMETAHHPKGSSSSSAAQHKTIIQIYTDWGNHYLEKARSKKMLSDLQLDLTDGVLLADLIEAVTNQKVPDVQRKPKTALQMVSQFIYCN